MEIRGENGESLVVDIARTSDVTAREVLELRALSGSHDGDESSWDAAIRQSMCVTTARVVQNDKLVGVCFLAGTIRHAQLCDLTVDEAFRGHGIGSALFDEASSFAQDHQVRYLGLTWDQATPWLHPFYERHGFKDVDFAMWHHGSLIEPVAGAVWARNAL